MASPAEPWRRTIRLLLVRAPSPTQSLGLNLVHFPRAGHNFGGCSCLVSCWVMLSSEVCVARCHHAKQKQSLKGQSWTSNQKTIYPNKSVLEPPLRLSFCWNWLQRASCSRLAKTGASWISDYSWFMIVNDCSWLFNWPWPTILCTIYKHFTYWYVYLYGNMHNQYIIRRIKVAGQASTEEKNFSHVPMLLMWRAPCCCVFVLGEVSRHHFSADPPKDCNFSKWAMFLPGFALFDGSLGICHRLKNGIWC